MISSTDRIARVFGPTTAKDVGVAALKSRRSFVRSNFEIGPLKEGQRPLGHILTAWEAYQSYGLDILDESIEYSGAALLESTGAIERTLYRRRKDLGLSVESVAGAAGVNADLVRQAEQQASRLPTRDLETVAFVLGLDERLLAFDEIGCADRPLAFRLKTLQQPAATDSPSISAGTALVFAEAASVIRVQWMLMNWLGQSDAEITFQPSTDYGSQQNPAWRVGYYLAEKTRAQLELENCEPIPSMRDLVEKDLGIPVVQAQLQPSIAGATITTKGVDGSDVRGFVLNTLGENTNVWVRRATLAHELGHILHDPTQELKRLRIDSYLGTLANPEDPNPDYVEQRANAFAIAFLAPPKSVRDMTPTPMEARDVGEVMQTFGISYTAARYHVFNAHYREDSLPEQTELPGPSEDWRSAEDFTLDYFPVRSVSSQRRGRFAGLVAACYKRQMLSSYTAALYLGCLEQEFLDNIDAIQECHPV